MTDDPETEPMQVPAAAPEDGDEPASESSETKHIEDDGEPLGANLA